MHKAKRNNRRARQAAANRKHQQQRHTMQDIAITEADMDTPVVSDAPVTSQEPSGVLQWIDAYIDDAVDLVNQYENARVLSTALTLALIAEVQALHS